MDEGRLDSNWHKLLLQRMPDTETPGLLVARVVKEMLEIDDELRVWVPDWDRYLTQDEVDYVCQQVEKMVEQ